MRVWSKGAEENLTHWPSLLCPTSDLEQRRILFYSLVCRSIPGLFLNGDNPSCCLENWSTKGTKAFQCWAPLWLSLSKHLSDPLFPQLQNRVLQNEFAGFVGKNVGLLLSYTSKQGKAQITSSSCALHARAMCRDACLVTSSSCALHVRAVCRDACLAHESSWQRDRSLSSLLFLRQNLI